MHRPLSCTDSGQNVGINSTPTIDISTQTLYVIAYTLVAGSPTYHLHALDLRTLNDKPGSPVTISASHQLANGSVLNFNATVQRQRSALLQSHGNIYAAFASFCDAHPEESRGWLLGWDAHTLAALPANELTDTLASAPTPFFLSGIWMSGYGVAAEQDGDLFFVTGNSDPKGNTYSGTTNIQESVVKMSANLSSVLSLFTPSNVFQLDHDDTDFGSGGVMVLPDQPGPKPLLAVAAGKDGRLFIMDRSALGGFNNPDVPKNVQIGECWCGPSYFKGSDGVGRVISSGGSQAKSWKINTAVTPALQPEASAPAIPLTPQDGGFFTTVSSDGTKPNTSLIWAISRPIDCEAPVTGCDGTAANNHLVLYAFNGTASGAALPQLWAGLIDTWPGMDAGGKNMNLVPTVGNGRVYAPGFNHLVIFGLISPGHARHAPPPRHEPPPEPRRLPPPIPPGARFWGPIRSIDGSHISLTLRTGKVLQVDVSEAVKEGTAIVPVVGRNVVVNGTVDDKGVLHARTMWRATKRGGWGTDSSR